MSVQMPDASAVALLFSCHFPHRYHLRSRLWGSGASSLLSPQELAFLGIRSHMLLTIEYQVIARLADGDVEKTSYLVGTMVTT
jgi:hypothetical protein